MKQLSILALVFIAGVAMHVSEASALNTSFVLAHCRGEVPSKEIFPVVIQRKICNMIVQSYANGFIYGNSYGQVRALEPKSNFNNDDYIEKKEESYDKKDQVLCISPAQWQNIGSLFSSWAGDLTDVSEDFSLLMFLFLLEEFKC